MGRFQDQIIDEHTHPIAGAEIWVFYASGAQLGQQAVLTSDTATALTQPLISDADGIFYYNATDGLYENHVYYGDQKRYVQQALIGQAVGTWADGDKGDITVSNAGVTWNIDAGAVGTPEIADGAVTLAKQANVASGTVFYRKSAGAGPPETQTLATLKTDLGGPAWGTITGTLASQADLQTALNGKADLAGAAFTGAITVPDQAYGAGWDGSFQAPTKNAVYDKIEAVIASVGSTTLTGDVTGTGTGTVPTTIANGAVTLAKQANVASGTIFYRKTASAGAPEVQTLATLKTDLGLTGTNSGDQTITLTGDVTGSGSGSFATAIGANKVTRGMLSATAGAAFLGATGAANVSDLTGTQATSLLDTFTSALKGLAPGSGGGTTNFLRADGTWAAPPGGGGTTTNALTMNNGGAGAASGATFNGSAAVTLSYNTLGAAPLASPTFTGKATTAASASGGAGFNLPHGAAPSAPVNGDLWTTTAGLFLRANGATIQFATGTGTATGTNTGDQTITLTGDVTGSGTGSFATAIGANKVTDAMLRTGGALSVIGRATNTTGNVADIATSADGDVLRRSGTALGFGAIATAGITNAAVTYAKIQNVAANAVLCNPTASAAAPSEVAVAASQLFGRGSTGNLAPIALGTNLSMSGTTLNAVGGGGGAISDGAFPTGWDGDGTTAPSRNAVYDELTLRPTLAGTNGFSGGNTFKAGLTIGPPNDGTGSPADGYVKFQNTNYYSWLQFYSTLGTGVSGSQTFCGQLIGGQNSLTLDFDVLTLRKTDGTGYGSIGYNANTFAGTTTVGAVGTNDIALNINSTNVYALITLKQAGAAESEFGSVLSTRLYIWTTTPKIDFYTGSTLRATLDSTYFTTSNHIRSTGGAWTGTSGGEAHLYGDATNGAMLAGNGSTYDLTIANAAGTTALTIAHNTTNVVVAGTVTASNLSGTNTGDQFTSIAANSILGNNTGSAAAASALTVAQTKTLLALTTADVAAVAGNVVSARVGTTAGAYSEVAMAASTILGRGSSGNVAALTLAATLNMGAGTVLSVASVPNAATFNNAGSGAASGTTFDGSVARTVSWNTLGAAPDNPRFQSVASAATVTPTFSNDIVDITAQAVALTLANPTGTAVDGWGMVIRIKDNGTARAITYGTQYGGVGVTLPTSTVAGKYLILVMMYCAAAATLKWQVTAVCQE